MFRRLIALVAPLAFPLSVHASQDKVTDLICGVVSNTVMKRRVENPTMDTHVRIDRERKLIWLGGAAHGDRDLKRTFTENNVSIEQEFTLGPAPNQLNISYRINRITGTFFERTRHPDGMVIDQEWRCEPARAKF